jgi:uncharacterized coiled-coil protein SlyX
MRFTLLIVLSWTLWGTACKRSSKSPELELTNKRGLQQSGSSNVDELVKQRDELISKLKDQQVEQAGRIAELSLERDKLSESKRVADEDAARIKDELTNNKTLSDAQRDELNTKLQAATIEQARVNDQLKKNTDEMTKAMETIKTLNAEIADLKAQIDKLNKEIDSLRKQLADEKAKNAASSSAASSTSSGTAGATNSTTTAGSTSTTTPPATTSPSTTTAQPSVSKSFQYFMVNPDASKSCFEFASTTANAALLANPCISPAPTRQLFHVEFIGASVLLVDDRTQMCVGLDAAAASPDTARLLLAACNRAADSNQLFQFSEINSDTGEFKLKNQKSGSCLQVSSGKVVQSACGSASLLETQI